MFLFIGGYLSGLFANLISLLLELEGSVYQTTFRQISRLALQQCSLREKLADFGSGFVMPGSSSHIQQIPLTSTHCQAERRPTGQFLISN